MTVGGMGFIPERLLMMMMMMMMILTDYRNYRKQPTHQTGCPLPAPPPPGSGAVCWPYHVHPPGPRWRASACVGSTGVHARPPDPPLGPASDPGCPTHAGHMHGQGPGTVFRSGIRAAVAAYCNIVLCTVTALQHCTVTVHCNIVLRQCTATVYFNSSLQEHQSVT